MNLTKSEKIKKVAKSKEEITKKKILKLFDFFSNITTEFFGQKCTVSISVWRTIADRIDYDNLEEFQKNFSNSQDFENVILQSSPNFGQMIALNIKYDPIMNDSQYPVAAYVSVFCNNKTEAEVEDLIQEIKEYVLETFHSQVATNIISNEIYINANGNNGNPTAQGKENFITRHKPLIDFVAKLLAIIVSLITVIGAMKSCNNNSANDEITQNQTFYSQQDEISPDTDNTSLLS